MIDALAIQVVIGIISLMTPDVAKLQADLGAILAADASIAPVPEPLHGAQRTS